MSPDKPDKTVCTCPQCGGWGETMIRVARDKDGEFVWERAKCPRCLGSGRVLQWMMEEPFRERRTEAT